MKAIALIRVSTEEQARDGRSGIDRQREAIRIAAQRHGLDIVRWVTIQESGKYILEDPQFECILADLASGTVDGVIVAEQSRIFRPTEWDDFAVLGHFKRNRKMIWTPTAAIDPTTKEGMLLLGVTGLMSGMELGTMLERMLGARDALRAQGFHGSAPHTLPRGVIYTKYPRESGKKGGVYSYDNDDAAYLSNVREAFRLLIEEDASYESLAPLLDLTEAGVNVVLSNPIWIGVRRIATEKRTAPVRQVENPRNAKGKRARYRDRRPLATPIEIPLGPLGLEPPLISRKTFDAAQRIMDARRNGYHERAKPPSVLVPGPKIRCECGSGHYHKSDKRGYSRYYCASRCGVKSFRTIDLERALERLFASTFTAELLINVLEAVAKRDAQAPAKIRSIDEQIGKLDAAFKKGYREFSFSKVSESDWNELRAEIEAQRRELLTARPETLPALFDAKALARDTAAVFAQYSMLSMEQRQALLRRALREIPLTRQGEITMIRLSGGFLGGLESWAKSKSRSRKGWDRPAGVVHQ